MSHDLRIKWIKAQITLGFGDLKDAFENLLENVVDENNNTGRAQLVKFLDGMMEEALVFHYTKEESEIEVTKEVKVIKKRTKVKVPDETEDMPEKVTEDTEEEAKPTEGEAEAAEKADQDGASEVVEEEEYEEMETETKMETVFNYELFLTVGRLPEDSADSKFVYFVRTKQETRNKEGEVSEEIPKISIPPTTDAETVNKIMGSSLVFGCIAGSIISSLEGTLTGVYMPLVETNEADGDTQGGAVDVQHSEIVGFMHKFAVQLNQTISQVRGDVRLHIPQVPPISDTESLIDDYELVQTLTQAMEEWAPAIGTVIETQLRRLPEGKGPLAEIEFWRNRSASLSTLYEQLNLPHVKQMIRLLELVDSPAIHAFKYQMGELTKYYFEAKDNVKFLLTLERHFKNISTGTLASIPETLPSMMNAIRMVWTISRHYNTDERMVPLLELIAHDIADKVASYIRIQTIFQQAPAAAIRTIQEGKNVLEKWKETYFNVRDKIEQSGRDQRWEFDRKKLFERTSYMAEICDDLLRVARVLEEFDNLLGPELKAVTGDAQGIEDVRSKVTALVAPLESIPFDVFDRKQKEAWKIAIQRFKDQLKQIESAAKQFIDRSFDKLRSAEGAFDLLLKFQKLRTSDGIKEQMAHNFSAILRQYSRDLDGVLHIFQENCEAPPIAKNQPEVAGAISWARSLFLRIKKPFQRFQVLEDMMQSEEGRLVQRKYAALGKKMREFETKLYKGWKDDVDDIAMRALKANILARNPATEGCEYRVNFSANLTKLIRETKYLDRLGFDIPETALNVTLQERNYQKYVDNLQQMLANYQQVLDCVSEAEKKLLANRLKKLTKVISPGLSPLNWNSLGILDYISNCSKAIGEFQTVASQVTKNASSIRSVITTILNADLVAEPVLGSDLLDVPEFFELMESHRKKVANHLLSRYRTIGPLLIKIEEIVAGTGSGRSRLLRSYYQYWERCVFNALNVAVSEGMAKFYTMLTGKKNAHTDEGEEDANPQIVEKQPIFKIIGTLSAPDIVITPSLPEIHKILSRLIRNIAETARLFVRWMAGTCVESEPVDQGEDDEPFVYSFYSDVCQDPGIIKHHIQCNHAIQKTFASVQRYLDQWKRFDTVWKLDKVTVLDRFGSKNPTCVQFDTKLSFYTHLAQEVVLHRTEKDMDFLRVSCGPLAESIQQEALTWVAEIGKLNNALARPLLLDLEERFKNLREGLLKSPDTLEDLKEVLNTISQIHSSNADVELEYSDVQERYRTLEMYNCEVPEDELKLAHSINDMWQQCVHEARMTDWKLKRVKAKFTKVTTKQVVEFQAEVENLLEDFNAKGPGVPGLDLDKGVEILEEYKVILAESLAKRDHLQMAERLFSLPLTTYPELADVKTQVDGLTSIYNLYLEQKERIEGWSRMLWAQLNIKVLTEGIDDLTLKLRKLGKELRELAPFETVEECIVGFRDSIPLMQDLKNEALRPRHWKRLMETTKNSFEIDEKRFTLANLFAMELHKFSSEIADITSGAMKELAIEKGLQEISDVWKTMRFEVGKYMKGNTERSYVLKGIDAIAQMLEDNVMNLQTMSSSRYVAAFIDEVHKWEKRLSHISEVSEIWMKVQRKWLYLESIFIGSEDIRQQLPEEAKRFDRVDQGFRKMMNDTAKNTNVLEACHAEGRLELQQSLYSQMEVCQKSLSDYLETKRSAFPRFYFISDDELLSILGSSDPQAVQEHMIKLYDNVKLLKFGAGARAKSVIGMISAEGEEFDFKEPQTADGVVEVWMTSVQAQMRSTLWQISKEAVYYYPQQDRNQWVYKYPGMVGLLGSQVWWTWEVEDVFRNVKQGDKHAMKNLLAKLNGQLKKLTSDVRGNLDSLQRKKVNTLIIIDVHARDIIDRFVRDSILDAREFDWESQMRFYWDKDVDDARMLQCSGSFEYGYEYMGLNGRLVITPLTDRCIMTCTQALTLRLGGSPAGPAGTGKTETVKDLAKHLARLCVVFNCGEGLDYKAMGRIFAGLVECGAWGCFDEFNRLEAEVLSVVSAQVKTIQNGMLADLKRFLFEGREIKLDQKAGFFITMNPGYAGRTELPDNLKAMFRPVTMVVPDMDLIGQRCWHSQAQVAGRNTRPCA